MDRATIYIFFGLIASGKSTLAELFAASHRFTYYNTDRVRKELAGLSANERRPDELEQGIYSPEFTEKTYQTMLEQTEQDLQNGACGVVLDGSYSRRYDRRKVVDLAGSKRVDAFFILCTCSDREVKRRLDLRAKDPAAVSDGRWEIFVTQKEKFESPYELAPDQLLQLDAETDPKQLLTLVEHAIKDRT